VEVVSVRYADLKFAFSGQINYNEILNWINRIERQNMNIIINGKSQQLTSAKNLSDIVSTFCKQPKHVITELNGTIIPSDRWAQINLQDGDALELVTFVGGG
jgi:thiamine biosynthesis protein ThiS